MAESAVAPEELAALADAMGLQVGYSIRTGRAWVRLDGELMYADLEGRLDLSLPGMWRLQEARIGAWWEAVEQEEATMLEAMTPEARDRYQAERHRVRMLPDPTDAAMDRARERVGEG